MQLKHKIPGIIPTPEEMERRLQEAKDRRDASWSRLCEKEKELKVIDFHVHTFPEKIAARALEQLSHDSGSRPFTDGTVKELRQSMKEAGVDVEINETKGTFHGYDAAIDTKIVKQQISRRISFLRKGFEKGE